jgi:tetratricopeptide (TPR) repeat protein
LAKLIKEDRLKILDMLQEISEKRLLVYEIAQPERQQHDPDWRFNHAITQQCLYTHLAESQKTEIHLRVAKIIEDLYPSLPDPLAWELARHYRGARHWEEAARYGLQVARSSYQAQSYIDVVETANAALSDLGNLPNPDPTRKSDLHWLLSRSQAYLQQFTAAEQNGKLCLELAEQIGDIPRQVGALTRLVEVYLREHRSDDLHRVYSLAWELACQQDTPALRSYVAQFWTRDISMLLPELSQSYVQQTIEIARLQGHIPALILGLYGLGHTLYGLHRLDESLAAFDEAIHLIDTQAGEQPVRLAGEAYIIDEVPIVPNVRYHYIRETCLEFSARIRQELGQWQKAIKELWEVHDSKVRFGDKPGEAGLQSVISKAYLMAGELDQALETYENALHLAEALESQRLLAQILRIGLQIAAQRKDPDLLAKKLEAFQQISGTHESYPYQALILDMSRRLSLLNGEVGKAARTFQNLLAIAEQHHDQASQANAHCGLATCGLQVRAFKQARSHAMIALELQVESDPQCMGDTLLLLSKIAYTSGAQEEAAERREQARQFFLDHAYTAHLPEVDAIPAPDRGE